MHFPADEIRRQIDLIYAVGRGNDIAGSALIFSSTKLEAIHYYTRALGFAFADA